MSPEDDLCANCGAYWECEHKLARSARMNAAIDLSDEDIDAAIALLPGYGRLKAVSKS